MLGQITRSPKTKTFLISTLILCAISSLGFLYFKTKININTYNETTAQIRALSQLDEAWNVEVLKSSANLSHNYDNISKLSSKSRQLKQNILSSELNKKSQDMKILKNSLDHYIKFLNEKEVQTEYYKSSEAILRNSERFLPEIIEHTIDNIRSSNPDIASDLSKLKSKIYNYILFSDKADRMLSYKTIARIKSKIKFIEKEEIRLSISNILSHVEVILELKPKLEEYLNNIILSGTHQASSRLLDNYSSHYGLLIKEAANYRLALLVYSAALLVTLLFLANKLRLSYIKINHSNKKLQSVNFKLKDLNDNLEHKVKERTNTLSKTLNQLKNSQMQLVQSAKMAAMGQMVAGIAHEINTPLGYINGNVETIECFFSKIFQLISQISETLVLIDKNGFNTFQTQQAIKHLTKQIKTIQEEEYEPQVKELIADMQYGLNHIDDIVINLKNFSRMDRAEFSKFDLHQGIESTLKVAHNSTKNTCQIVKEYSDLPKIECISSQINQVLLNLIINACDAINETNNKIEKKRMGLIKIKTFCKNSHVFIEVQDSGCGIDEVTLKRMFDPFYTTKDVGKGTGLGLSITSKIIKNHKGTLRVTSKLGIGSKFTIGLPIHQSNNIHQNKSSEPLLLVG